MSMSANPTQSFWWKWGIPLGILVLIAVVGLWAHLQVEKAIQSRLASELKSTLDANVTALEIWMQTESKLALALSQNPEIATIARSLLRKSADSKLESDRQFLISLEEQQALSHALNRQLPDLGFWFAQLVNTNSFIVGDTGPGRFKLGQSLETSQEAEFTKVFNSGEPVIVPPFRPTANRRNRRGFSFNRGAIGDTNSAAFPFRRGPTLTQGGDDPAAGEGFRPQSNFPPPGRGNPDGDPNRPQGFGGSPVMQSGFMQVAAPIRDENSGEVLGALGFVFNPETAFTRILTVSRRGESGETFAFDMQGLMISKSRWDDDLKTLGLIPDHPGASSALSLELTERKRTSDGNSILSEGTSELILPVREAIQNKEGASIKPFLDYRGKQAVGVWKWLPNYQFGLALLMDADEAYRPLQILRYIFLTLILVIALFGLGVAFLSYLGFLWRQRAGEAELAAIKLGQYTLDHKIGEGGMGVVYKAHHALLRRETAIKILPIDKADPTMIRMFEREVQLTCRLQHPNTIQVYDYGRAPDGSFYYAMEYLEGLNLKDLVEKYGAQSESRTIQIMSQVCDSLKEAHQMGLIHRDIKPANIFLCSRGGLADFVKTLDFGLVKPITPTSEESLKEETLALSITGTPMYMPPEALENPQSVDERGDIYSLAAVGFYLLTGRSIFEGGSVMEVCRKQLTEPVPSARVLSPDSVSESMDLILQGALSKRPADRPASVCDLKSQLVNLPSWNEWSEIQKQEWWTAWKKEKTLTLQNSLNVTSTQNTSLAEATLVVDLNSASRV